MTKRLKADILVVDDDRDARDAIADVLEMDGYSVRTAADGLEALASCQRDGLPDLIVLDLMMPGMNGWQFVEEARRRRGLAQVPVLVASASLDGWEPPDAAVVLTKPLDIDTLLANVRDLLKLAA